MAGQFPGGDGRGTGAAGVGQWWLDGAHRLTPAQTEAERPRILRILPVYNDYAARAGARPIRVFRLTPT